MQELTLGVIGGLGPAATLDFCQRILHSTEADSDQAHLHVIVDNNPKTPDRNLAILRDGPSPVPSLTESAQRLQSAGANFLAMPCNTAHAFADDIARSVTVPFVNMVDEACAHLLALQPEIKTVGLLAADGCMAAKVYHSRLSEHGLELLCLDAAHQRAFMELIYRIKAGDGKKASLSAQMRDFAHRLISSGAQTIIAGCTEVPLVLAQESLTAPLLDSTQVLAERCIAYAKGIASLNMQEMT